MLRVAVEIDPEVPTAAVVAKAVSCSALVKSASVASLPKPKLVHLSAAIWAVVVNNSETCSLPKPTPKFLTALTI